MSTPATPILSWEAFEQLPDGDGSHRELMEGELQILPPPKANHSIIANRVFKVLLPLDFRGLGSVFLEAGYNLSADPATWLEPDASFLRKDRVRDRHVDGYFHGGPELAVEIVSPSESATDLQNKVRLFLQAGTLAVWVIFPKTHTVEVHLPTGTSFTRILADTLDAPFLLDGWQFPVAQLFAD